MTLHRIWIAAMIGAAALLGALPLWLVQVARDLERHPPTRAQAAAEVRAADQAAHRR